jgi:hypothetical protein
MTQVLQSAPDLLNVIGDIYFRNSDLAGADQVADRLQKMLPPQLQDNQGQLPPEAQAAVGQAQQQMQLMQGELQKLTFEKQAKMWDGQNRMQQIQVQSQADLLLEDKKLQTQIAVAEIQTKAQIVTEREQMLGRLEELFHKNIHATGTQGREHAHEHAMATQEHIHSRVEAQQAAETQSALAAQSAAHASQQSAQDAAQSQQQLVTGQ